MKRIVFALLCSVILVGCREDQKTAEHQHTAKCGHSSPVTGSSMPAAKPEPRKSVNNLTDEQIAKHTQLANDGDFKSAYVLYMYYSRHEDQEKAAQWNAKTRELAGKLSSDNPVAAKVLASLDHSGNSDVAHTNASQSHAKQFHDLTEADIQKHILLASDGNFKSAYTLCLHYSRHGDKEKTMQWASTTKELIAKVPQDSRTTKMLSALGKMEQHVADQSSACPIKPATFQKE